MYPVFSRRQFLQSAALLAASGCGTLGLASCAESGSSGSSTTAANTAPAFSSANTQLVKQSAFAFDTTVTLQAYCGPELMQQAIERCYYFESIFSRTIEGSDVWRINHAQGAPVEVAAETAECIRASLEYSKMTQGLFDITIGAVSSLWDFENGIKPDDQAIQDALPRIGYQNITVLGNQVTLADADAAIDLGGIAKGYIADDLHRLFTQGGCTSGLINLGGNIMLIGAKPDGSPWNVGIQDPNGVRNDCLAKVEASDKSLVTSGLYERQFTQDGIRYYHILDPRTGYPAQTDLLASSILSDSSLDGDALATALFLMGKDQALDFLNQRPQFSGMVVDQAGAVSFSDNAPFQFV